ncbi:MAG: patatin-like phospholipase family protein [Haliscomenobacter sp.]|nr:patatin-like phospholipase family protein [Haliscomenobacter sp.]
MDASGNRSLGLALSGGGARGAYQIGVWKALEEAGLTSRFGAATGASVGAINGALVCMGDWEYAFTFWTQGDVSRVFDQMKERKDRGLINLTLAMAADYVNNRGLRVNNLRETLRQALDEPAIRRAAARFGLVVYNQRYRVGEYWFVEDIPSGFLSDFVLASASFPLFQPCRINGQVYRDGGLADLIPFPMAFGVPGISRVIGIDVSVGTRILPAYRRRVREYEDRLLLIRPSKTLPLPLNFSRRAIYDQIRLGIQDGRKAIQSNLPFFI